MRFVTIRKDGAELAGVVTKNGVLPVKDLNRAKGTAWEEDLFSLIEAQQIPRLTAWYNAGGMEKLEKLPGMIPKEEAVCAPLYRNPKRIFGIGLNYADHAADIGDAAPKNFPTSSIWISQPQTSRTKIIPSCTWQRLRMHAKLSENSKDQNRHSALQRNGGSVSIWPNIC